MSQVIATFSNNGDFTEETVGYFSEKSNYKIPQKLIQECIDRYVKTGDIHLILDISDKIKIAGALSDKCEERELKLEIFFQDRFEVVSWYELMEYPSRQTFYDSITKNTDLFERHKSVLDFMNSLNFEITNLMGENNSQQEILWDCYQREYSYTSKDSNRIIVRVKPNLIVEVLISPDISDSVEINKRYFFFYNPSQIFDIIIQHSTIEAKRNLKIKSILT